MQEVFYYIFIACAAFAIKLVLFRVINYDPILPMDFLAFFVIYVTISIIVQIVKDQRNQKK